MHQMMVLAGVLAFALVGCAANNVRWVRAGATAADFDRDKAACVYESNLATPGSYAGPGLGGALAAGIADGMRIGQLQQMCMQARGWQQVSLPEGATLDVPTKGWLRKDGRLMAQHPELVPVLDAAKLKCTVRPETTIAEISETIESCMDKNGFLFVDVADYQTKSAELREAAAAQSKKKR